MTIQKIIYSLIKIESRKDVINLITKANAVGVINDESLNLVKASLNLNRIEVRDIMIVRHDISFIESTASYAEIMAILATTGHSRFPVLDVARNRVVGIFHIKDLLLSSTPEVEFNLIDYLRPVVFVPEYKMLDKLLMEMQIKKNHMCVVVDEFTNIIGIVTLEMILELIVGDIDDEYDLMDDSSSDIVKLDENSYRIKGDVSLKKIQTQLNLELAPERVNNLSSYIIKVNNGMPEVKQIVKLNNKVNAEIISVSTKRIELVNVILL